jgi:hypothetical protein
MFINFWKGQNKQLLTSELPALFVVPSFPSRKDFFSKTKEIYLYMCGRCEWQSNPRPNLHMQEESKFRRWIS